MNNMDIDIKELLMKEAKRSLKIRSIYKGLFSYLLATGLLLACLIWAFIHSYFFLYLFSGVALFMCLIFWTPAPSWRKAPKEKIIEEMEKITKNKTKKCPEQHYNFISILKQMKEDFERVKKDFDSEGERIKKDFMVYLGKSKK